MTKQSKRKSKATRSAVSPIELADRWGKTRQFVYDQIHAGKIKSFKAGRSTLIHMREVERIESGE